jgi:hypothetical protein
MNMPESQQKMKKGGKNTTTSPARKQHYAYYAAHHVREQHKVKRVLISSGYAAAKAYATLHGVLGFLADIIRPDTQG